MVSGRSRVWSILLIAVVLLGTGALTPLTTGAIDPILTPVANPDKYTAPIGSPLSVAAPGVLGNDYGGTLTASKVSDPAHGAVTLNADGSFSYTPTGGFSGTDSFTYRASNGAANSTAATVTITVPQQSADLYVLKALDNQTPTNGASITYTVTVGNNGPDAATNVTVTDTLPAGVTFVSASPSAAYNSATGVWTVGALANQASATLTITTTVTDNTTITNAAFISHSDQSDPNTNNNYATAGGNPNAADLIVFKTVDKPVANPGDAIAFTITVRNNGPAAATNVQVTDQLPFGVTFVSALPSAAYNSTTGVWTVGALANQGSATLTVNATAPQNQTTNSASVTHSDQVDVNPGNNNANVAITPPGADLALNNTVDKATPTFGENITLTLTATNNGPNNATNVQVSDAVPGGTTFVSATPTTGTYDRVTGTWTIGAFANQASATLTLVTQVATPSQIQSQAYVSRSDQYDPNTTNNSSTATSTPVQPQLANVAISQGAACVTNNIRYTETFTSLSLTNGPASTTLTVTMNPSGGDTNIPSPVVAGTFTTNPSGAGSYTGATNIPTTSAVANYPTSIFVTVTTASAATVAFGTATLTGGSALVCTQPSTLVADVTQSASCGDNFPKLDYVESVDSLTLTGGPPNTTLSVQLQFTGGDSTIFTNPRNMGTFTTDVGGHGTFTNVVTFKGPSPSNYPTAVNVVVFNGATMVNSFTVTIANGHLHGNAATHC